MITSKRDLLVLSKRASNDPDELKHEVDCLDAILLSVETTKSLCKCAELLDMNRYKIITKPFIVEKLLNQKELKPFQFLFNKN